MTNTQPNLDRLAALHAQRIISRTNAKKPGEIDNMVTKALGVLQENGVYACFLYLMANEKNDAGEVVVDEMLEMLSRLGFEWNKPEDNTAQAVLIHITDKVTVDLERLLLAKETLEQMLIYARYGAKAR
ncbi:MAG: hypothetical protein ACREDR_42700 [Blastocatellia bacterium]